jgi:hypothetical protein
MLSHSAGVGDGFFQVAALQDQRRLGLLVTESFPESHPTRSIHVTFVVIATSGLFVMTVYINLPNTPRTWEYHYYIFNIIEKRTLYGLELSLNCSSTDSISEMKI